MASSDVRAAEPANGGLGQFLRRLFGGASLLSLAGILQQGLGFFLLPVYTRYLGPEDYGRVEVLMVSVFAALMVFGQGMPPALLRALTFVYADDGMRGRRAAGTALTWMMGTGLLACAFAVLISRPAASWLFGSADHASLVWIGGLLVGTGAWRAVSSSVLYAAQRPGLAVGIGFAQFLVKLALNILLVVVLQVGFAGIIWSHLVGEVVGLLALAWALRGRVQWGFDAAELRSLLGYGVPLIGSTLGLQVLVISDRYIIGWLRSPVELGLYAVAHKFSTAFYLVVLAPLSQMWEVNSLDLVRDRAGVERIARLATLYVVVGAAVVLGAQLLSEPVLAWLLPESFLGAEAAVGILVAGSVLHGLGEIFKTSLRAGGESSRQALVAGIAAVLNVGLTIFMVRQGGFVGAALATMLSLGAYAWLTGLMATRSTVPVPWDMPRLVVATALIVAACFAQPAMATLDPATRMSMRGWLLLGYLAATPLLVDEPSREAVVSRVRLLMTRARPAEGSGHA